MTAHPGIRRYVVELRLTGGYPDVRALSERARAAGSHNDAGAGARFVRTVYVPEDGACLLVFEAQSPEAARDAASAAGLEIARVSEALTPEGP